MNIEEAKAWAIQEIQYLAVAANVALSAVPEGIGAGFRQQRMEDLNYRREAITTLLDALTESAERERILQEQISSFDRLLRAIGP